jgi:thiol-disulfide isomerase/thioredoxin
MSKRILIPALFLAASVFLCRGASAAAISWKYDLPAAFDEAGGTGKPVMVDFYAIWCGWCKKLDATTYSNPVIQKLAEEFISVKIDGDKNKDIVAKYRVSGYPTVIFFDSGGNIIINKPGYSGADVFAGIMKDVLSKAKKPAGGYAITDEAAKDNKIKTPFAGSEFAYNGYLEMAGEDLIAQINYGATTYFVRKGDTIKEYEVVSIGKDEVVLEGKGGRLVMEFKKPVRKKENISFSAEKGAASAGAKTTVTAAAAFTPGLRAAFPAVFAVVYIYFALCLYYIAKKTQTKHAWLAWIPVAGIFLMCSAGKIRFWWLLLLLAPIVNIFMVFFIWYKVIKARGKPGWLLILSIVPLVNCAVMGYLAFSK